MGNHSNEPRLNCVHVFTYCSESGCCKTSHPVFLSYFVSSIIGYVLESFHHYTGDSS